MGDNINLINISKSIGFENFLVMPPAYYKYNDDDVFNFYSKLIENVKDCRIILYNFEKLSGYKFSIECVSKLAKSFPKNVLGVKDSSYNLYENLKIENFSVMPGSESKLLKGLELNTQNYASNCCTSYLAETFMKFKNNLNQTSNEKLCMVRSIFDKYNLISGLHTFMSTEDTYFKNLIPPLKLLSKDEEKLFFSELDKLNFNLNNLRAA